MLGHMPRLLCISKNRLYLKDSKRWTPLDSAGLCWSYRNIDISDGHKRLTRGILVTSEMLCQNGGDPRCLEICRVALGHINDCLELHTLQHTTLQDNAAGHEGNLLGMALNTSLNINYQRDLAKNGQTDWKVSAGWAHGVTSCWLIRFPGDSRFHTSQLGLHSKKIEGIWGNAITIPTNQKKKANVTIAGKQSQVTNFSVRKQIHSTNKLGQLGKFWTRSRCWSYCHHYLKFILWNHGLRCGKHRQVWQNSAIS